MASREALAKLSREELVARATREMSKELLIELALQYDKSKSNEHTEVQKTPATAEALVEKPTASTPAKEEAASTLRQRKPARSGAELWKAAQHKVHTYHAVTHQIQHRATEKVGFGVAEHMIELVAEATLEGHAATHTLAHGHTAAKHGARHAAAKHGSHAAAKHSANHAAQGAAGNWLTNATCAVRELGPKSLSCGAAPLLSPTALRVWSGCLDALKLAIPLAGTFLISHMAHHDLHRVHHEQHKRGSWAVTTLLFCIALFCDTLDAIAHAVIVVCMLAEYVVDHHTLHEYHLDHHFVHEVHHAAFYLAIGATSSMVLGEFLAVRAEKREPAAKPMTMQQKLLAAAKGEAAKANKENNHAKGGGKNKLKAH